MLQTRHNAELAAIAALRDGAAVALRSAASGRHRAATFVRGLLPPRDGSSR